MTGRKWSRVQAGVPRRLEEGRRSWRGHFVVGEPEVGVYSYWWGSGLGRKPRMRPGAGVGRRANIRIILDFSGTMQARSE